MSDNNDPTGQKEDICVTKLISEVKKRPALYDRSSAVEKKVKQRHWTDICQTIIPYWDTLEIDEKQIKAKVIQNRWHELRREFITVHEQLLEEPKAKRTKWSHYDNLLFLVPFIWETETDTQTGNGSVQPKNGSNPSEPEPKAQNQASAAPKITIAKLPYNTPAKEKAATEPAKKLEPTEETGLTGDCEPTRDLGPIGNFEATRDLGLSGELEPAGELQPTGELTGEAELPQIGPSELGVLEDTGFSDPGISGGLEPPEMPQLRVAELPAVMTGSGPELSVYPIRDIDENYHFLISLVPAFRRFSEDQRFLARMEIMRLMRQIGTMGQDKVSSYNTELMKYPYAACEAPANSNVLDPVPAPMPTLNDQAYPGMHRTETGEIQYPETDPEDYDV